MGQQPEPKMFKIGDVLTPDEFPWIEDAYRITRHGDLTGIASAWFVLFVAPTHRASDRVADFVARVGFETYWPRQKRVQKVLLRKNGLKENARKRPYAHRVVESPLLPCYILVRLPADRSAEYGLTGDEALHHGIVGFVATPEGPVTIPDRDVADLVDRERNGEFDETAKRGRKTVAKAPDWLEPGRAVRIANGPFAEFHALVERHVGEGRVKVLANIFGRAVPLDLDRAQVAQLD